MDTVTEESLEVASLDEHPHYTTLAGMKFTFVQFTDLKFLFFRIHASVHMPHYVKLQNHTTFSESSFFIFVSFDFVRRAWNTK